MITLKSTRIPDSNKSIKVKESKIEEFIKQRIKVLSKLNRQEKRNLFITSDPLKDTYNELLKEDLNILCEINNYLLKK